MDATARALAAAVVMVAAGCGDGGVDAGADAAQTAVDAGGGVDAAGSACPREPAPANRDRKLVIAHPFDAAGNKANAFEVWQLSAAGALTGPLHSFEMGRGDTGVVHFTPDGEVGIVAQEDGTLGVFGWDAAGAPVVRQAALAGDFYAADVVIAPAGDVAYVLDTQWRDNGGGIYRLPIACDGALGAAELVVPAKLPAALAFVPGDPGTALLAADDALGSPMDLDAHRLAWSAQPSWIAGVDAFPDDDAIVGAAALTADGRYFLIGDNSGFSGVPNRVAVVEVTADGLAPRQVLTPIEDPYAIVTSPFDNTALVVSGFGNALFGLAYDPTDATAPFADPVELTYAGAPPQLPGKAVLIDRGALRGRVLIAENQGVRQVELRADGSIVDLGLTAAGSGLPGVVGAIGVQR